MASKLLFLAVTTLSLYSTDSKLSLRDYCDEVIYGRYTRPAFIWNPRPYAIAYYKRCIDHEGWVDCIMKMRKKRGAQYKVEGFEKRFPPRLSMIAAGIVFCDMRLHRIRPNKTDCIFNQTMCNQVWETKDDCIDSYKKVVCIWSQISKCGMDEMKPILDYEFGLLGSRCLETLGIAVYPHADVIEGCNESAAGQLRTSLTLVLLLCSIWVLISFVSTKTTILLC